MSGEKNIMTNTVKAQKFADCHTGYSVSMLLGISYKISFKFEISGMKRTRGPSHTMGRSLLKGLLYFVSSFTIYLNSKMTKPSGCIFHDDFKSDEISAVSVRTTSGKGGQLKVLQ